MIGKVQGRRMAQGEGRLTMSVEKKSDVVLAVKQWRIALEGMDRGTVLIILVASRLILKSDRLGRAGRNHAHAECSFGESAGRTASHEMPPNLNNAWQTPCST